MANVTIGALTLTTSAAAADLIEIEVAASGLSRRITKANFIGATLTGGGTIATGGFGLTVGANSTINGSVVGNMTGGGTVATGGNTLTVAGTSTVNGSLVGSMTGSGTVATGGNTLTVAGTSSIAGTLSGGGTVATGGFTLTAPATGTVALLGVANVFTQDLSAPNLQNLRSISMNDDTSYSFLPKNAVGTLLLSGLDNANLGLVAVFRAASSRWMSSLAEGSAVDTSTSQLTGTTGVDGQFTVSAYSDGMIYLENRTGSVQRISLSVLS